MKIVSSPVEQFPGTVSLPDPIMLPVALEYESMVRDVTRIESDATPLEVDALVIPFLVKFVLSWNLENFPAYPTAAEFPVTPRVATSSLIAWIIGEIGKIYRGEQPDPNE